MHTPTPTSLQWFDQLVDLKDNYGLRFVIGAGFQMARHRQLHDIDVMIHPCDFPQLVDSGLGVEDVTEFGTDRYRIQSADLEIEFFPGSYPPGFGYLDLLEEGYQSIIEVIQVPPWCKMIECWTRHQTRRWKEAFGRDKDFEDLKLLFGPCYVKPSK